MTSGPSSSAAAGAASLGTNFTIDDLKSVGRGSLASTMGIVVVELSGNGGVATMPVEGNTQPYGVLHGGASVVLAETLGSLCAAVHAGPDRMSLGIEVSASHHRAVTAGLVTATATAVSLGRTLASYEIVITDEAHRRICTSRLTCAIRDIQAS